MLGLGAMFGHPKPRFDHRLVVIALTDGLEFDREIYAYLKQGQYSQLRLHVPPATPTAVKFEPGAEPTERLHQLEEQMKRQ